MPPRARKSTAASDAPAPRKTAKRAAKKAAAPRKATTTRASRPRPAAVQPEEMVDALTSSAEGIRARTEAGMEEAVTRIREMQERLLEEAKRGGLSYLDAYEKSLASMLAVTERAAESTQLEWVSTLTSTYAEFVRRMSDAFVRAAREIIK